METIINKNIGLIHHVASRIRTKRCKVSHNDLVQEGVFGIIEAHKRYDPQKGAFSTYAYFWIRKYMIDAIHIQSNTIRCPRGKDRIYFASLDELHDQLQNKEEAREHVDCDVTKYLCILTPREKAIVRMKCGFIEDTPMTFKDIGDLYGITGEAVRQTYNKAVSKMRSTYV